MSSWRSRRTRSRPRSPRRAAPTRSASASPRRTSASSQASSTRSSPTPDDRRRQQRRADPRRPAGRVQHRRAGLPGRRRARDGPPARRAPRSSWPAPAAPPTRWSSPASPPARGGHDREPDDRVGEALAERFPAIGPGAARGRGPRRIRAVVRCARAGGPRGQRDDGRDGRSGSTFDVELLPPSRDRLRPGLRAGRDAAPRRARARGLRAANGSEMLIAQAAIAFERWTGVGGMAGVMRAAVAPLLADPAARA